MAYKIHQSDYLQSETIHYFSSISQLSQQLNYSPEYR